MITKDVPKVPKYHCSGERNYSVCHTRIRNKCSNLNVDLYYNHLSQEACDCGNTSETPQHFFFNVKIMLQKGQICLEIFSQIHCR